MNDAHHVGDIDRSVLVDVHGTGIQFIFAHGIVHQQHRVGDINLLVEIDIAFDSRNHCDIERLVAPYAGISTGIDHNHIVQCSLPTLVVFVGRKRQFDQRCIFCGQGGERERSGDESVVPLAYRTDEQLLVAIEDAACETTFIHIQ